MSLFNSYQKYVQKRESSNELRSLPRSPKEGFIDLSSNDYLGLSKDLEVIQEGIEAALKYGAGATGSRLISGNNDLFENFEEIIAQDKNFEASLIFNSGFQANSGVLDALSSKDVCVIFDKLNHASMYHGVFASGAKLFRFRHLDYDHLEEILKTIEGGQSIIASETVFGMDGDFANLQSLINLSDKYGALLYLDEAHATGLYGPRGYGLSTAFSLNPERTVVMGTFSKALGSSGAYVCCSSCLKTYLTQKSRSFVYSTALSPFCVGTAFCSWKKIPNLDQERQDLQFKAEEFRKKIGGEGKGTNIVPLIINDSQRVMKMKEVLDKMGIRVSGIRPPTSPTPRLRMAVTSCISAEDLDRTTKAILQLQNL